MEWFVVGSTTPLAIQCIRYLSMLSSCGLDASRRGQHASISYKHSTHSLVPTVPDRNRLPRRAIPCYPNSPQINPSPAGDVRRGGVPDPNEEQTAFTAALGTVGTFCRETENPQTSGRKGTTVGSLISLYYRYNSIIEDWWAARHRLLQIWLDIRKCGGQSGAPARNCCCPAIGIGLAGRLLTEP